MKNKRIRLVALVLTLAMAFSICAVPASAAVMDENKWYYGQEARGKYLWFAEAYVRAWLIENWDESTSGEMTETALAIKVTAMKSMASKDSDYSFYEGTLPTAAYIGMSETKGSYIYWYSEQDWQSFQNNSQNSSIDFSTGTITYYTSNGTKKQMKAINGRSSSSGSSSDSGAVLLLAGGAVVAVVGIYLYTHPAVVQKIKDFFAGNSATQSAAQTAEAESEAAAVNEADVNETATQNEAEPPAEIAPAA
jgi:hypothetical protein